MKRRTIFLFLLTSMHSTLVHANPVGISYSHAIVSTEPENLNGFHVAMTYEPQSLIWPHLQIYFDAGYSHWWVTGNIAHRNLSIYSLAPYFRYYFFKQNTFSPYVQASLGIAYLTKTRLDDRNLGMHFAFQDQVGVGLAYGREHQFYTTLSALHYSNGAFCSNNSGMTVPILLSVGYRF